MESQLSRLVYFEKLSDAYYNPLISLNIDSQKSSYLITKKTMANSAIITLFI